MISIVAVSTCNDPHFSAIHLQDALWIGEEARWFDETFLVEGLWIQTTPGGGIGFVGQCM